MCLANEDTWLLTICTISMQTASVSSPRVSFKAAISSFRQARFTSLLFTSASGSSKLNTTQHCCSFRTTRPGCSPAAVSIVTDTGINKGCQVLLVHNPRLNIPTQMEHTLGHHYLTNPHSHALCTLNTALNTS